MYREFFKLREHPFSLTPDTDFWFDAAGHRDAMNVLCAMLRLRFHQSQRRNRAGQNIVVPPITQGTG
jgi:hypothetical protein